MTHEETSLHRVQESFGRQGLMPHLGAWRVQAGCSFSCAEAKRLDLLRPLGGRLP